MKEILTYILFGSGIILHLTMCFIAGITIGKLINNEKKEDEQKPPFPLGKPAIVFEIYEKHGDLYTLYASDLNEEYKIRIPNLNLFEGDMFAMIFDENKIYYDRI